MNVNNGEACGRSAVSANCEESKVRRSDSSSALRCLDVFQFFVLYIQAVYAVNVGPG